MATFYLILVIALFFLAISDLVVGVSNDAVNFLNSAVGSKAASFKIIMLVAALGVLAGASFSSGMMEVARKGIFHPEYFYFSEIIILFLAVMLTDVILLDTFNTLGMPTSTTVSIVFELLGAAVAISLVKIYTDPNALHLYEYINSSKALAIISGILLSVVIAFSCGIFAQYLSRLLFSFDYEKRMRKYGAIWGGMGIMAITYFMLIKGAKGASFMSPDFLAAVNDNTVNLLVISFLAWTAILYFLNRVFRVNILQVLVMVGTFALAMAFAGNDLVNFIGVPLAGYNAYQLYIESGAGVADTFLMDGLAGKVATPTFLLLLAGVIMVITLYTSRKAKSVIKTSLDLGRQEEGYERFSSSMLSRSLVRNFGSMASFVNNSLPDRWRKAVDQQFDQRPFIQKQASMGKKAPSFDMLRASVTLVVASILIAIGTNLKLPLSTTYVTFMVFMGTSLADRSWGRESAVYRVSGVLSVIGGWFFTALSAFVVAFIIAIIFKFGGMIAIAISLCIAAIVIYRTHRYHNERMEAQLAYEISLDGSSALSKAKIIGLCVAHLKHFLHNFGDVVDQSVRALGNEDLTEVNQANQTFKPVLKSISSLRLSSNKVLDRISENELEVGHLYMLVVDYLNEMANDIATVLKSNLRHVANNHKPLLPEQIEELQAMHVQLRSRYDQVIEVFKNVDEDLATSVINDLADYMRKTRGLRKNQIKRIKMHEVGTRNSNLFLSHLGEFRNLALFSNRIVQVFNDLSLGNVEERAFFSTDVHKELKDMKKQAINLVVAEGEVMNSNDESIMVTQADELSEGEVPTSPVAESKIGDQNRADDVDEDVTDVVEPTKDS